MGNENLADHLKKVISERIENLRVYKHKIERDLNCDNECRAETPTSCFQIYIAHWRIEGKLAGFEKVLQDIQNWELKEAEKENKNSTSKYGHSVSFTRKDLFGGDDKWQNKPTK